VSTATFDSNPLPGQRPVDLLYVHEEPGEEAIAGWELDSARSPGLNLVAVKTLKEAIRELRARSFDAALLDLNLPGGAGLVSYKCLHDEAPALPVVAVTGFDDPALLKQMLEHGITEFLPKKHIDGDLLGIVVRLAIERKRLEQQVAERTAGLQAVSQELEAFAYSVSHDLRAPLRAIDGFSEILEQDHAKQLGEAGRDCVMRIRRSAQRMEEMIGDLLSLSRITRGDIVREDVDVSALVSKIAQTLQAGCPGREVKFDIADGIRLRGDAHLLGIMLENLLNNAWKFTAGRPAAQIEFNRVHADGKIVCYVRDNGVGFNPAYAEKLFGAFQRLHHARDFPGHGIGLATVQRIVNKHGGRIWAEAEPDKGATFYFTL
jgi:signal transduction histidine kinase